MITSALIEAYGIEDGFNANVAERLELKIFLFPHCPGICAHRAYIRPFRPEAPADFLRNASKKSRASTIPWLSSLWELYIQGPWAQLVPSLGLPRDLLHNPVPMALLACHRM